MATTADRRLLLSTLAIKHPVRVATTADIDLDGLQTIDGIVLAAGDRVLVKDQDDGTENGIYRASTGTWNRDQDFNDNSDFVQYTRILVGAGATYAGYEFQLTTASPNIGTSNLTFAVAGASSTNAILYTASGTGAVARTLASRLGEYVSVKDFGAVGDGVTDDTAAIQAAADFCFGSSSSPNASTNAVRNKPLFFPNGDFIITSPITVRSVHGGKIAGAARFATKITQTTPNASVFVTNGFEYSVVENIGFVGNGSSLIFDLDWDGTGGAALQSNSFKEVNFGIGSIGLRIGNAGSMGSETLVENCLFGTCSVAGLKTCNFNALQQTIIGGDFQSCGIGIWSAAGSVPVIKGVGFQGNTTYDIQIDNAANDTLSVDGCRSESTNFAFVGSALQAKFDSCEHFGGSNGTFILGAGTVSLVVDNCVSEKGQFGKTNGKLSVRNSSFGRVDWIPSPPLFSSGTIEIENVLYGQTTSGTGAGSPVFINRQRISGSGPTFNYSAGVTGSFTCAAAATTVVTNANVTASSKITLTPTNAAAATLMGSAKCLFISAISPGVSFTVATASGGAAAGTETFDYSTIG